MQFCDNGGAAGPEISIQNITVSILPQKADKSNSTDMDIARIANSAPCHVLF